RRPRHAAAPARPRGRRRALGRRRRGAGPGGPVHPQPARALPAPPRPSLARLGARRRGQAPWHFLYFRPEPQGQGSLRPTLSSLTTVPWTARCADCAAAVAAPGRVPGVPPPSPVVTL